jgi:hypothetical protein
LLSGKEIGIYGLFISVRMPLSLASTRFTIGLVRSAVMGPRGKLRDEISYPNGISFVLALK